jgi:hypothetical protein
MEFTWPVDLKALAAEPIGTIIFGYVEEEGPGSWPGVVEFHNCPAVGGPYGGPLDGRWTLISRDPLTVSPSIWCKPPGGCGMHGFIRDGKWVAS